MIPIEILKYKKGDLYELSFLCPENNKKMDCLYFANMDDAINTTHINDGNDYGKIIDWMIREVEHMPESRDCFIYGDTVMYGTCKTFVMELVELDICMLLSSFINTGEIGNSMKCDGMEIKKGINAYSLNINNIDFVFVIDKYHIKQSDNNTIYIVYSDFIDYFIDDYELQLENVWNCIIKRIKKYI